MTSHEATMVVDCVSCPVRGLHCGDCMVPALLEITAHGGRGPVALDPDERAAVTQLVRAGLLDAETAARARAELEPAAAHDRAVG